MEIREKKVLLEYVRQNWEWGVVVDACDLWEQAKEEFEELTPEEKSYIIQRA